MDKKTKSMITILGLDGATLDVIQPLREEGYLPNLDRLMSSGTYGTLQSTLPPVTGPAWAALATGISPGESGIFDFRNRKSSYSRLFESINSSRIQGKAIWDLLSSSGKRVAVYNYPMLYPAYPINGMMVSGLLAPLDGTITYPTSLRQELDRLTGGYTIEIPINSPEYLNNEDELVLDLFALLEKNVLAIDYLIEHEQWDLFAGVISVTDLAQHCLWKDWDSLHPLHNPDRSGKFRAHFIRMWQRIDTLVGNAWEKRGGPDDYFFVLSDHGFGPLTKTFKVNEWLATQGLLSWQSSPISQGSSIARWLLRRFPQLVKYIPNSLRKSYFNHFTHTDIIDLIEMDATKAFMPAISDICAQIYINQLVAGRRGSTGYEETVQRITEGIESFAQEVEPPLAVEIFRSEEVYSGANIELGPDLFVILDNFSCRVTAQRGKPVLMGDSDSPNRSGTHRMEGVLIANGPGIPQRHLNNARIIDIAPTILHLAGLAVPVSVDGRVLTEILPESFAKREIEFSTVSEEGVLSNSSSSAFTDEDEAALLQRLSDLGYV